MNKSQIIFTLSVLAGILLLCGIVCWSTLNREEDVTEDELVVAKEDVVSEESVDSEGQEDDVPVNYRIYKNKKYGFKAEIREDWFFKECESGYVAFDISREKLENLCNCPDNQPCYSGLIYFNIKSKTEENLSLYNYWLEDFSQSDNYESKKLKVGGVPAKHFYFTIDSSGFAGSKHYVFFQTDNHLFRIGYQELERTENSSDALAHFKHILSTVSF